MARATSKLTPEQVGLKHGFRSGLEEATAADLRSRGIEFDYEKLTIEYEKPARKSKYTPDFRLYLKLGGSPDHVRFRIIETKGRFVTADRQKMILIKAQHPTLDIRILFNNPNARISKQSKTTYAMWCQKHGFPFAKGPKVPEEWLRA